ncbi:hypothetical protein CASFOL_002193 [Castilleja foliolosa]|uniref:Ty3 transposon capsid-like protein domain-containing protein n=1 Tax=Castilleja foliolosa TaxID=1961234 RepID=A0ABD3EDY3_9LAMI
MASIHNVGMNTPSPEQALAIDTRVTEIEQSMIKMQRDMKARFARLEALLVNSRPFRVPTPRNDRGLDGDEGKLNLRRDDNFQPKDDNFQLKSCLEAPRCDGNEPRRWINQVKEYFDYNDTPLNDRLLSVAMMLEGPAADWYRWRMNNGLIDSWEDFLMKFKLRFDPLHDVDYFGQLARTRQIGTVMEYQTAFEKILIHIPDASESHLQLLFHSGLKNHLQHEISLLKPATLSESFALARELEAKHETLVQSVAQRQSSWQSNPSRNLTQGLRAAPETPLMPKQTYSFGKVMLVDDDKDIASDPDEIENVEVAGDFSSLNCLEGVTIARSFRLLGNISNSPVEVLLDGVSTYNFIHSKVVEKLQWSASSIPLCVDVEIQDVCLLRSTLRTRWFSKRVRMLWIREDRVRRITMIKKKYHRHKKKSKTRFVKVVESR